MKQFETNVSLKEIDFYITNTLVLFSQKILRGQHIFLNNQIQYNVYDKQEQHSMQNNYT